MNRGSHTTSESIRVMTPTRSIDSLVQNLTQKDKNR